MAKEKVQLPGTPNEIVVKVRAQKVWETWLEGLKDPYKHGVCALLVLFAVLLGFRRGEQKARTWTIAKLRWREALGRALAANQYDTTVAQANEVMRAEPKWNVGWNPMLTDADGAKSIRAEVRDKGEPRMKSCKLNSSGIDIEILAQLDARGGKARFAYEIIRAVNSELGCGWDATDPKMVEKLNDRLKKLQAKGLVIEVWPVRWCRTEWEAGKEARGGSSSAPARETKYSNPFKVGQRVHHDPTGRNGVVVGIEGEVVEFQAEGGIYGPGAYGMEQFTLIHKTPAELDAEAAAKEKTRQTKERRAADAPPATKYSNPFKVGQRVHHDPTGRNGVVVGIEGEVVEFQADGGIYGPGAYGMEQFTLIHKTPAELDAEAAAKEKAKKTAKRQTVGRPPAATAKRKKAEGA